MNETTQREAEVRKLWLEGPAGRLEAALRVATTPRALAVVGHPHPLHGGTMHNPVIFHSDRELHRAGMTTLRFNFRGVGSSEGAHDEGNGEVGDVGAAVAWLRGLGPELPLLYVGFSFGAWCGIRHAVGDATVSGLVAIGLPVIRYPFEELARLKRPFAVVQAESDELGTPDRVREATAGLEPPARIHEIHGTTHLFPGRARDAAAAVVSAATAML